MKTKPTKKPPTNKPYILPRIPSQLIAIALEDLEKCERSKRYRIDMLEWHIPYGDTCWVCAAGAVMAKRLNTRPTEAALPGFFGPNMEPLEAINALRRGHVYDACSILGAPMPYGVDLWYSVASYSSDPSAFKRDLRRLAKTLKEAGI